VAFERIAEQPEQGLLEEKAFYSFERGFHRFGFLMRKRGTSARRNIAALGRKGLTAADET
jgi:hypothetical protein